MHRVQEECCACGKKWVVAVPDALEHKFSSLCEPCKETHYVSYSYYKGGICLALGQSVNAWGQVVDQNGDIV